MKMESARTQIVEFGRRLVTAHLTTGTGGNLSFFDRKEGLVAIKPSGVDYFEMKPEDVALFEPDGTPVEVPKKPSSETAMHLEVYRRRPDVNAVVHAHSVFATTVAENCRVARGDASDEEIRTALRRVGLGEWLYDLPDGVETVLEDGYDWGAEEYYHHQRTSRINH